MFKFNEKVLFEANKGKKEGIPEGPVKHATVEQVPLFVCLSSSMPCVRIPDISIITVIIIIISNNTNP
jgi:hypothetical protein